MCFIKGTITRSKDTANQPKTEVFACFSFVFQISVGSLRVSNSMRIGAIVDYWGHGYLSVNAWTNKWFVQALLKM